ncbi:hypothetical protein SCHPADRAFT_567801 [Schizopora paradoxa]|uniref:Uncharacterized protein n=1 Tax=Schizopora paradoxa TaxID=27342 RepID=A0A0H2RCY9_9AGAM|nr:hypothetical protein SCHPADRAFT_567801 [Schizopora paradoxa]
MQLTSRNSSNVGRVIFNENLYNQSIRLVLTFLRFSDACLFLFPATVALRMLGVVGTLYSSCRFIRVHRNRTWRWSGSSFRHLLTHAAEYSAGNLVCTSQSVNL